MVIRKIIDTVIQDSAPGNICKGLQRMGINAQVAARGHYEEKIGVEGSKVLRIGNGESLGIIDIPEGYIRWINVRRITSGGASSGPTVGTHSYFTDYGVPDPKLESSWHRKEIKSIRVKNFPVFGKVIDLRWKGDDLIQEIVCRLEEDTSIRDPIMKSRDLLITAYTDYGCWILSTASPRKEAPSREVWDCYQKIARHLTEH